VRQERAQVLKKLVRVNPGKGRQPFPIRPDGRRQLAAAHDALEITVVAYRKFKLLGPFGIFRPNGKSFEIRGKHASIIAFGELPSAKLAASFEVVLLEAAAKFRDSPAPPNIMEPVMSNVAEYIFMILAARQHVTQRCKIERNKRSVSAGSE